ncbi:MAG: TenA family protein [Cardiobacteriaceae bacterium]|nr:TenA family protein [Cardiobacteriaceae bacterium]
MTFQDHRQRFRKLPFSDQLHTFAEHYWQPLVHHRFFEALGTGTLDEDLFARYLIQDHALLHTRIRLVASALIHAPDMAQKRTLSQFLLALTDEDNTYFARSFAALGVPERLYRHPVLNPATQALDLALQDAAQAGYPQAITALLVIAWSDQAWAQCQRGKLPPPFYYLEWINLHDTPAFDHYVDWLRHQTDSFATLHPTLQNALAARFNHLCKLRQQCFDTACQPQRQRTRPTRHLQPLFD